MGNKDIDHKSKQKKCDSKRSTKIHERNSPRGYRTLLG